MIVAIVYLKGGFTSSIPGFVRLESEEYEVHIPKGNGDRRNRQTMQWAMPMESDLVSPGASVKGQRKFVVEPWPVVQ